VFSLQQEFFSFFGSFVFCSAALGFFGLCSLLCISLFRSGSLALVSIFGVRATLYVFDSGFGFGVGVGFGFGLDLDLSSSCISCLFVAILLSSFIASASRSRSRSRFDSAFLLILVLGYWFSFFFWGVGSYAHARAQMDFLNFSKRKIQLNMTPFLPNKGFNFNLSFFLFNGQRPTTITTSILNN
jgi:hypothetical protein